MSIHKLTFTVYRHQPIVNILIFTSTGVLFSSEAIPKLDEPNFNLMAVVQENVLCQWVSRGDRISTKLVLCLPT